MKEVMEKPENDYRPAATLAKSSPRAEITPSDSFYSRAGKRIIDAVVSLAIILVLSPFFLFTAVLIKLSSRGPVLYRQHRVGKDGQVFKILKFRSMVEDAERKGPGITCAGDVRITEIGAILRRFKLDEFPQFWNVFKGDMSLVGPRPELPVYVANYDERQRCVLSVRPGITDKASLKYRWEEEVLASNSDPERFYRDVILPHKLALNLEYVKQLSLANDLGLLVRTAHSMFAPRSRVSVPMDE
jgi:lipopolysaccharide/colanic/teichoic acid biosynthesis glycosyltransferase